MMDEFSVWSVCKPHHQNDRVWARWVEDMEKNQSYRTMDANESSMHELAFLLFLLLRNLLMTKHGVYDSKWNSTIDRKQQCQFLE